MTLIENIDVLMYSCAADTVDGLMKDCNPQDEDSFGTQSLVRRPRSIEGGAPKKYACLGGPLDTGAPPLWCDCVHLFLSFLNAL